MSPLTACGAWLSPRTAREKCWPCNGRGCQCCQGKGRHYLPGTQENQAKGSALEIRIQGEYRADQARKARPGERVCRCCGTAFAPKPKKGAKLLTCAPCRARCITKAHRIRSDSPHRRAA
jgi:hypothetical protein